MTYWYLASPYSNYLGGHEIAHAHMQACFAAALLIKAGVPVYSPIAHSHMIARYGRLDPLDHSIWLPADKPMMDAASGLIVLMLEGWTKSRGVACEIDRFIHCAKPIFYMTPGLVPKGLTA